MDFFSYEGPPSRLRIEHPEHLYGLTPTTFYKYFYDAYILKKTLTKVDWSTVFDSKDYAFDHDKYAAGRIDKKPSYQKIVNSYFTPKYTTSYCGDKYDQESKESFRQNVVRIAREHPDTMFYLYFSPSSILDWLTRDNLGYLQTLLEFRSFVAEQCQPLKNVRLYDFQAEKSITHNLNIYFDITHYDKSINELIISEIHADSHRTNPE